MHDHSTDSAERAVRDLHERTLQFLGGHLARLVYLASTRDYSTGRYYHDGLAFRFSAEAAEQALESAHCEIFEKLLLSPLQVVVEELERFIGSCHADPSSVVETWRKMEPYRLVVPLKSERVARELFFSNIKIALEVVRYHQQPNLASRQSALPLQ